MGCYQIKEEKYIYEQIVKFPKKVAGYGSDLSPFEWVMLAMAIKRGNFIFEVTTAHAVLMTFSSSIRQHYDVIL